MTINVPTHFVEQFTTNVAHLLQIQGGAMRGLVTEAPYTGDSGVAVDQYGSVEMLEVTSRFAPMGRVDAATDRRWVFPVDYELPQMISTFDKLRMMIDPQSVLAQAAVMASARRFDETIFNAFFADAKTGRSGATTTAFDTTNHRVDAAIGAAADSGLNVDKIIRGRRLLRQANVNLATEKVYMAITGQQEEDLLRQSQVVNTDYFTQNTMPVLVDGRIVRFAGINIVVSEMVPSNATYRLCPMWVASGMHLGVWSDVSARVDERPDISGVPYQLSTTTTIGATRLEEGRVIQIECTE